jgi:hypothetical protein
MGHYYSELMCDKCGKLLCICEVKPVKAPIKWVVVDESYNIPGLPKYSVCTTELYLEALGDLNVYAPSRYFKVAKYNSRADAEDAAMKRCEQDLKQAIKTLNELKHTLKFNKPWEVNYDSQ